MEWNITCFNGRYIFKLFLFSGGVMFVTVPIKKKTSQLSVVAGISRMVEGLATN